MAPRLKNSQLETRSARAKLAVRKKPYPARIAPGIAVAYRRNEGVGTWSAVVADGKGGSWLKKIALADDCEDANGTTILTFWQAAECAKRLARADDGPADGDRPATVKEALEGYKAHVEGRGQPGKKVDLVLRKLTPSIANKPVALMTVQEAMAFRAALLAGVKNCTATRYWGTFCAAMNRAARMDKRIKDTPWKLEALVDDTEARNVILPDADVARVVSAAYGLGHEWGLLVDVLAQTGTRISQAQKLKVADILTGDRLNMPSSEKRKEPNKPLPVTPDLAAKLRKHAAGRKPGDRLLVDASGKPWADNCQNERFPATVKAAGLDASVTSYALRHSSIVRQLLAGVPIRVVASNHNNSVEMIEKHYSAYICDHSDALTRRALLGGNQTPPTTPVAANDNAPDAVSVAR